jgi:hypothetical protein
MASRREGNVFLRTTVRLLVTMATVAAGLGFTGRATAATVTFGDTTPGPSIDLLSNNVKAASKYTAVQGSIVKVTAYLSGLGKTTGSENVKAMVYADNGAAAPGSRLGVSNQVTISAGRAWGWVDFTFATPIQVHPSQTVWMGYISGGTTDLVQAAMTRPAGNQLLFNSDNYATGPSDPFGTGTWRDKHYSLYATVDQPTIFGDTAPGSGIDTLSTDLKEASKYTAVAGKVSTVSAYLSGLGATSGSQKVRAIAYADSAGSPGSLLGFSNEVTIGAGRAWGWVDFTFPDGVWVQAGVVWIGFQASTPSNLTQAAYSTVTANLRYNSDAYADGPASTFGTGTTRDKHYSLYASLAPATPLSARVGMNVPNIGTNNVPASYASTVANDDGITLVRDGGPISATYGSGPTPNWLYVDRMTAFVNTVPGSRMLLSFWTAPDWMHPANTGYRYPPDAAHRQDWANSVVAIMDRFVAAGIPIDRIEIWNEPWLDYFWQPSSNPTAYEQLVVATASTVWAHYPTMKIGISADYWEQGSGNPANTQWFQQVLNADTTGALNDPRYYFTTHNYVQSDSPITNRGTGWSFDRYALARNQAMAHGFVNPHVDVTEYGWRAGDTSGGTNDVTVDVQATYTVDGAKLAFASGFVDRVFVFEDYPGDTWGYNVHYPNGTTKPVAPALKTYIQTG